ncbi:tetratricopeptide repeat-containing glycosyltransferase family protein [Methylobacillus gramineus]|uniref:tetratricopeptide repeat-containing glycosyltransferase family protein n=1 Tax=Methylobacillus gramineus TaxID=755169 RepID=UPI001CFFF857|nr:tetratricopeptide repeat-containing glycosyltransferase family protein [Methylobacillus gramineus]MCB5185469.1 tetratricopeptide repeat-containing glycosyltransferase family protein [Methylobacillus gramineus]
MSVKSLLARADALLAQDKHSEALETYNLVLAQDDANFDALVGCGRALTSLRQYDFSLAHFNFALTLKPDAAIAYHYRALAYHGAKRFDEALLDHQKALELNPGEIATFLNLANTLAELDRAEEALEFYNGVIAMWPKYAIAYNNRGNLFLDNRMIEEALVDYAQAAKLDPGQNKFRWNQGLMQILLGQYLEGWKLYEAGFETAGFARGERKRCPQPQWLGKFDVKGKRVLLYAEQGYGDTMQFCRYAHQVAALGAQVILEVQAPLVGLLKSLGEQFIVVAQGSGFTEFDYHCPIMSLPMVFGTTLETVPAEVPYLVADKSRQSAFNLGVSNQMRIGLVWSGSASHKNDHRRSIPLATLAGLLKLPASFHCLQKEIQPRDQALLAELPSIALHTEQLKDFNDTAALVDAMDLVISVDTSVAHLAGALGKPVWVLLPFVPDYRWLLDRTDTPWYPTGRLFRQPTVGDWDAVLTALEHALLQQLTSP